MILDACLSFVKNAVKQVLYISQNHHGVGCKSTRERNQLRWVAYLCISITTPCEASLLARTKTGRWLGYAFVPAFISDSRVELLQKVTTLFQWGSLESCKLCAGQPPSAYKTRQKALHLFQKPHLASHSARGEQVLCHSWWNIISKRVSRDVQTWHCVYAVRTKSHLQGCHSQLLLDLQTSLQASRWQSAYLYLVLC